MDLKDQEKNTAYAATIAAEKLGQEAVQMGLRKIDVMGKGPGAGRESAIRALAVAGLEVYINTRCYSFTTQWM
ncbi:MAG: hypothetical protein CM1200mP1_10310 [Candidatus Neomarinimicrobiota bacterium]|nr:MAG: hypothetical protein CM1200mP1_10310 [Candidatus Neomarinimicrobiota bacterium]